VVSRPTSIGWNGTFKTQTDQVEFVDEDVDDAYRIGIADVVVEALGKSGALASMFTLNEALHRRSLR
jgi:hypothetical protein